MPRFRIYRMKDAPRQQFRWAPHVSGAASVKHKDYQEDGHIEAGNEYEAWKLSQDTGQALDIGDLLETESGELRVCKYVGFEAAYWIVPELKTGLESAPAASGPADQHTVHGG